MPNIRYDEIGSLPWCEQYREAMDELMEKSLAGDKDAELLVVNCAAHFYGLVIWDFMNVRELIAAIKALDNQLENA